MEVLKKENAWVWILLMFFTGGASLLILGALLGIYKKGTWYSKWYYWVLGILTIIPGTIMVLVFYLYTLITVCKKLDVAGSDLYAFPYTWILCIIVPIIGWILLLVMFIYLNIWYLVKLYQGSGEKFI